MAELSFTSAGSLPAISVEAIGPTCDLFAGWGEILITTLDLCNCIEGFSPLHVAFFIEPITDLLLHIFLSFINLVWFAPFRIESYRR